MRKNLLLLFCMSGIAMSCSNDLLPVFDDDCDWQTSLSEITVDNKELFADRGMEITGACQMKDMKLDRELLCGGEYGSFPVYSDKDSIFTVLTYDELRKDAKKYNYDMDKVDSRIDSILSHADDYDIIQLEWTGRAGKFYTLALFNKLTAELEYDNMLYNMSTLARYDSQELSVMVSGFEFGSYLMTKSDVVVYYENLLPMASAGLEWDIYGVWDNPILIYADTYYYYYNMAHTFTYDQLYVRQIRSACYGYETHVDFRNFSTPREKKYTLRYALWAGPENTLHLDGTYNLENISLTDAMFQNMFKFGVGKLETLTESKLKNDSLIIVPVKRFD